MSGKWELDGESFGRLLQWLDSDIEQAGLKYEKIRHKLIVIFMARGCPVAEELADLTFDRVSKKVEDISSYYVGDPSLFIFGVANKVFLEWRRQVTILPIDNDSQSTAHSMTKEIEDRCLTHCLAGVPENNRKLLLDYYDKDKQEKIDRRKALALDLGLSDNALKIKVHRLRVSLRECLLNCIKENNDHFH